MPVRRRQRRPGPRFLETYETHWLGDDSIDRDASDIRKWCETADGDALVVRDGAERPDVIRWRALTDQEWDQLPVPEGTGYEAYYQVLAAQTYMAFRMGLIAFGNWPIMREEKHGVRRLTEECLYEFCEDIEDQQAPLGLTQRALLKAKGIEIDETKDPGEMQATSFVHWLGSHILRASFCRRTRGKV